MRSTSSLTIAAMLAVAAPWVRGDDGDPKDFLQQTLSGQFALTKIAEESGDIATAGTVVALRKNTFMAYSTASPVAYINKVNKKGNISQPFMANVGAGVAGALRSRESGNRYYPTRRFRAGEKLWIIGLFVQTDGITFRLYSDPFQDIRYYGDLKLPFEKGSVPTPDEAMKSIAAVLTVDESSDGNTHEAPPPSEPARPSTAEVGVREQPAPAAPGSSVLQNEDVIKMAKAGLDDSIIISKLKASRSQFDTAPDTLIALKQSGISAAVFRAMTEAAR
jgi:hypothetical protein